MGTTKIETRPVLSLSEQEKMEMWRLFAEYYADISIERFFDDLLEKQKVLLMKSDGVIKGFSTLIVYEIEVEGRPARVLFTGDTIKDRSFWGDKKLAVGFFKFILSEWAKKPLTPFYWFLISKGYKTYMFLARNLVEYWPRYDKPMPARMESLIRQMAVQRYPEAYVEGQGILRFSEKLGRLKEGAVPLTERDLSLPEIAFFLKKNPGHENGDELCCVGRLGMKLWCYFLLRTSVHAINGMARKLLASIGATSPSASPSTASASRYSRVKPRRVNRRASSGL